MTRIANQRPAPGLLDIRLAGGVALLHIKTITAVPHLSTRESVVTSVWLGHAVLILRQEAD